MEALHSGLAQTVVLPPVGVVPCPRCTLLEQQYAELQARCEQLEYRLNQLTRRQFGRKGEKHLPTLDPPARVQPLTASSTLTGGNGRKPLPADLPRQNVYYDLPSDSRSCAVCHKPLSPIGEEVSEQLDYVPAQLQVKRHVRRKYGCTHCGGTVRLADKPEQPIAKGLATSTLLAHIIISKYEDHLPLHRQERMFRRQGIDLARSTLCDWVGDCARLCQPLVAALRQELLQSPRTHSDDTPVPVQDRKKPGKTHTGRLWVYIGCGEQQPVIVVYDYTPTRSQSGPLAFLQGYHGFLQADAYAGYNPLYESGTVQAVACWAHTRRKFYEVAVATDSTLAQQALTFIQQLYEVEQEGKALTGAERYALRQAKAKPLLEMFKAWLDQQAAEVLPKSALGGAIRYALTLWPALTRYVAHGCLEIDNNRAERAIKPLVLGRKNWTFAGSHDGAQHAAVLYSLIETCKQNGVDAYAYLTDVLARLPTYPINRVRELLPYRWQPASPPTAPPVPATAPAYSPSC